MILNWWTRAVCSLSIATIGIATTGMLQNQLGRAGELWLPIVVIVMLGVLMLLWWRPVARQFAEAEVTAE